MKEFVTAVTEAMAETDGQPVEEQYVEFKLDGRVMKAYTPTDGQLAFMLAATGRGQSSEQRLAGIINIMLSTLEGDDKDYFEARLLTRDPKDRLGMEQINEIFEYLTEEWFARPTKSQSGSATTQPTTGPASTPTTSPETSSDSAPTVS